MDYKAKKIKNQVFQELIKNKVSEKNLKRIRECGNFLLFHTDAGREKRKLVHANNCENRFCPVCAYKKARKDAMKISIMLKYVEKNCKFLFLTLTAPNVTSDNLTEEITDYNKAFKRFILLKPFEKAVIGYIRKLEITYNKETDTYHPHFHILLAVKKSYFSKAYYIKQEEWLEMWRKAKRDESITQVDIRRLDVEGGVMEFSKYTAKDSDYLQSDKVFDIMYKALKGRQIITYNGLFKETSKMYKNGELDYLKDVDLTEYMYRILYQWGQGEYVEKEIRELTQEEKDMFNKQLIDEMDIEE